MYVYVYLYLHLARAASSKRWPPRHPGAFFPSTSARHGTMSGPERASYSSCHHCSAGPLFIAFYSILKPFSYLWFGLSIILGNFMSKLIVSFVFFSIIIPVGFIIRLFKHNAFFLNEFKNNKESMFIKRNHVFELNDIIHPF